MQPIVVSRVVLHVCNDVTDVESYLIVFSCSRTQTTIVITRNPKVIWEKPRRHRSRQKWTRSLRVLAVQCLLQISPVTQPPVRYIYITQTDT